MWILIDSFEKRQSAFFISVPLGQDLGQLSYTPTMWILIDSYKKRQSAFLNILPEVRVGGSIAVQCATDVTALSK